MLQVRNLDNKRVCDISDDKKTVSIVRGKCITKLFITDDGHLAFYNERVS